MSLHSITKSLRLNMFEYTVYKGSANGSVYKSTTTRPPLVDDEVLLSITAAGLCGTDNHFRYHDMVLGHEGVGVVEELGPNVRSLRKGDRVGWGYQHSSCGTCQKCLSEDEIFCPDRKIYGESDLDQGAFASQAIWKETFLFKLPDGLTDVEAAPLMCAGSTVYFALKSAGVSLGNRVGVFGLGGLGHLAIQFAVNQGCNVSVFSETEGKGDDAIQFGAEEFHFVKDSSKTGYQGEPLHTLLVTTSFPAGKDIDFLLYPGLILRRLALSSESYGSERTNLLPQYSR
ncbi:chaperonin 10-like protein [Phaeosphaeriaceae sp. PMI808]|nr:chaperonin 10-like protein [Phaeosphaeriaceae sp. PMI808]